MKASGKLRVLVVDDSLFMRAAVAKLLTTDGRFEVVGQAKDGAEAVDKVIDLQPDVVTMDFNMPRMTGAESVRYTDPAGTAYDSFDYSLSSTQYDKVFHRVGDGGAWWQSYSADPT